MSASDTPVVATDAPAKPPNRVQVSWDGDFRFRGRREDGGPSIMLDGKGIAGPGPVDSLLIALASCTGIDVTDILAKRRTPVESLGIGVIGDRAPSTPARLTRIHLTYDLVGVAVERVHAERAIELAVTKYCSVRDSLDPATPITWTLVLNGA